MHHQPPTSAEATGSSKLNIGFWPKRAICNSPLFPRNITLRLPVSHRRENTKIIVFARRALLRLTKDRPLTPWKYCPLFLFFFPLISFWPSSVPFSLPIFPYSLSHCTFFLSHMFGSHLYLVCCPLFLFRFPLVPFSPPLYVIFCLLCFF